MVSIAPERRIRNPLPGEEWRPVPGWEDLYEVSSHGRVWSRPRPGTPGGLLAPLLRGRYRGVKLSRDGRVVFKRLHRLVGEAFFGELPPGQQTRHGPAGAHENGIANLCYGTPAENIADQDRDGTRPLGSAKRAAKLTEAIVAECRARWATGETQYALAAEFGVSQETMSKAVTGLTWRHVTTPPPCRR